MTVWVWYQPVCAHKLSACIELRPARLPEAGLAMGQNPNRLAPVNNRFNPHKWVVNSPTNQNGIPLVLTHSHMWNLWGFHVNHNLTEGVVSLTDGQSRTVPVKKFKSGFVSCIVFWSHRVLGAHLTPLKVRGGFFGPPKVAVSLNPTFEGEAQRTCWRLIQLLNPAFQEQRNELNTSAA